MGAQGTGCQDREASGQFGGDLGKILRRWLAGPYSPPTNGITRQGACVHLRVAQAKWPGLGGAQQTELPGTQLKRGEVLDEILCCLTLWP